VQEAALLIERSRFEHHAVVRRTQRSRVGFEQHRQITGLAHANAVRKLDLVSVGERLVGLSSDGNAQTAIGDGTA